MREAQHVKNYYKSSGSSNKPTVSSGRASFQAGMVGGEGRSAGGFRFYGARVGEADNGALYLSQVVARRDQ